MRPSWYLVVVVRGVHPPLVTLRVGQLYPVYAD
jgi:hypothetical protein